MDKFEESVLDYICGRPERFVNPQFEIPYDGFRGGSCPDFVVIDFGDQTVYIVEVTVAAAVKRLEERVRNRQSRWFDPLREHFQGLKSPTFRNAAWEYHVTIFVRGDQFSAAEQALKDQNDVSVLNIEKTVFGWGWNWQAALPANPLRANGKERSRS